MTTAVELPGALDRTAVRRPAAAPRAWTGFAVVLAAMIMNILDSTIINVAAPSIQRDLGMSSAALEWIAAAYTLAIAVGLMAGGRLGDMFGRKRMLMIGLTGFVLASAACALAPSAGSLIAARVLQGLSAALITPQAFGLIRDLFPPAQMSKAFAALGPVIGLSTVAGPIVAGVLLKADLLGTDWRSLFLINLPLGVFALAVGARVLPARPAAGRGSGWTAPAPRCSPRPASCSSSRWWTAARWAGRPGSSGCWPPPSRCWPSSSRTSGTASGPAAARWSSSACWASVPTCRACVFVLVFFASIVGFSLSTGLFLQIGLGYTADPRQLPAGRGGGGRVHRVGRRRLGGDGGGAADPAPRAGSSWPPGRWCCTCPCTRCTAWWAPATWSRGWRCSGSAWA